MITTDQIKALRDKTGLSVMQCKKALEDASGDEAKAEEFLRAAGAAIARKKADRELGAGVIGSYIHGTKQVGTIIELDCETDFVAKNEAFVALAYDIAMHITASMPADVEAALEQPFIKDPSLSIRQLIEGGTQKFGERIALRRFSRFSTLDA